MYLKSSFSPFLFLSFFLLSSSSAAAFNITQVLSEHSDFSTLNSYITDTQLAGEINGRQSLTILAVDNGGLSQLSSKPKDVIKKVLSLHVLLDYFDLPKLQKIPNDTQILPTLFQASGPSGQLGFLNVTHLSSGGVAFGSAVNGAPLAANFVKSIVSQPYNLSVLQISSAIIPPGISNSSASPSPPPSPPPPPPPPQPSPAPAPEPSPSNKSAPVETPAKSPPPAKAPSPAKSPSPVKTPAASPPPKASPPSPTKRPFLGPVADQAPVSTPESSQKGEKESSAAAKVGIHLAIVIMLVSSLWSLPSWI